MKEIPLYLNCGLVGTLNVVDLQKNLSLNEGIDVEWHDGWADVKLNDQHQRGIDASLVNNPTSKEIIVPSAKIQNGIIPVYSILRRTPMKVSAGSSDGNPLVYALKRERNYKFRTDFDKAEVKARIAAILDIFVKQYFSDAKSKTITVICPSENHLNTAFAKALQKSASKIGKNVSIHSEYLVKYPAEDVRYEVIDDAGSDLNRWLIKLPKEKARQKREALDIAFGRMEAEHNGVFAYHFIKDQDTRQHISNTMRLSTYMKGIDGEDVIVLDDTMSNGKTISEACSLLCGSYLPKTITALTLFSPLK